MKQAFLLLSFCLFAGLAQAQAISKSELLKQLLTLEAAVLKEDKQKVAEYFLFPINNETLKLKVEYDGEKEITITKFDRATFLKNYASIISADFVELFRQLDLSQLKGKSKIAKEYVPKAKTDFCTYNYEVAIEKGEVKIHFLLNNRDDIKLSEEDFCPEYAEFWTFEVIKGKLKFKGLDIAG